MRVYIGTSGYFYWGWKGRFYPEELQPSRWFKFYAEKFNTVEINSTFYRFPTKSSLKRWYRDAPRNFKFTVKMNREITHIRKLNDATEKAMEFYDIAVQSLAEKLGTILFQLPPGYRYSEENLDKLLRHINREIRTVVEFRHRSWWNEEVFKTLRENDITFCTVDAPGLPNHLVETSSTGYIRFHGRSKWYDYDYPEEELETWAEELRRANFDEVFVYFNNDKNAYAPLNALTFRKILRGQ